MMLRWALAALILLAACAPSSGTFARGDDLAVRTVLGTQVEAWNRGDLDGFMGGYVHDDTLVFTSSGKIRRGWQETYARYREKYCGRSAADVGVRGCDRSAMGHLAIEIISVQPLGADGAIVLGHWTVTGTTQAGHGVFSVALARTHDGWRVVHDHSSVEAR
jgi:beta-aspartyl-peptidase (threonine type)